MRTYHVSCEFEDSTYPHHTEFKTNDYNVDNVKQQAKKAIADRLDIWNFDSMSIKWMEIYYYDVLNEIIVFSYNKKV